MYRVANNCVIHDWGFHFPTLTVTNKTEYVVHKPNFGSHRQLIQIRKKKQSDEVIKARVQVVDCINVKPKIETSLVAT